MNVVGDTPNSLRMSVQALDGLAEIRVQVVRPFLSDEELAVFRGEDQMIMKEGVGGGHGAEGLAPLPGCGFRWGCSPVVSLRSTTGYKMECRWHQILCRFPLMVSLRSTTGYRMECRWHQILSRFPPVVLLRSTTGHKMECRWH